MSGKPGVIYFGSGDGPLSPVPSGVNMPGETHVVGARRPTRLPNEVALEKKRIRPDTTWVIRHRADYDTADASWYFCGSGLQTSTGLPDQQCSYLVPFKCCVDIQTSSCPKTTPMLEYVPRLNCFYYVITPKPRTRLLGQACHRYGAIEKILHTSEHYLLIYS